MKRVLPKLMVLMLLGVTVPVFGAPVGANVTGVVRDVHGTPQMGALVELLAGDASMVVSTFTDDHGRYILPKVIPGHYQVRATAAFFVPATRPNLTLQAGAQAVVNLTMSTLFEAENWLPAQRRRADEPTDDWKWTLRSTASRPLLRMVDPEDGVVMSTSAEHHVRSEDKGQVAMMNGDGAFGDGGVHQVIKLSRTIENGDGAVFRADVGNPQSPFTVGPSVVVSTGYEGRSAFGGSTRLVAGYQTHPEVTNGVANGFQMMQLASTEQMSLGDLVMIDAGTLIEAERLQANRISAQPYLHVTGRPGEDVVVEYRFATGRQLQTSADLDRLKSPLVAMADANGRPVSSKGSHQELSVSRKLGSRDIGSPTVSFAVYADSFGNSTVMGSGSLDRSSLAGSGVVADPTTGTFQLAAAGYQGRGMSVSAMQPLTPALSVWAEYDLGTALRTAGAFATGSILTLADLQSTLSSHTTQAVSASVRGKILRTGTALKAQYRWQPERTLTQVNAYNAAAEEAYMSFYLRQRLWCGRILPQGVDAVVEATNLLEQGYQPVLAPDGHTLFLAQVPRAIQGGLAFNF